MTKIDKTCGQMSDLIKCSSFSDFPNKIEHYLSRYDMFFNILTAASGENPLCGRGWNLSMLQCSWLHVRSYWSISYVFLQTNVIMSLKKQQTEHFIFINLIYHFSCYWFDTGCMGKGDLKPLETDKIMMFTYR